MQEIKKRKIVFAAILKPVDDTRMTAKMGQSLVETGQYEVHVIGFPSKVTKPLHGITTHPSKYYKRLSLSRLIEPLRAFKKILAIKPDVLIISSHELLGLAVTIKFITNCKLVYDVQENYFRNILHTNAFPFLLRPLLAVYVRAKEISFAPFINYFILAEKGYENEFNFPGKKKAIFENKAIKSVQVFSKKSDSDKLIHLLFSGTLAETTGIFSAINLAKELHRQEQKIRLTIVGYCAQQTVLEKIKKEIQHHNFINLIGGDYLIPHAAILQEIQQADFGIISYPLNASTKNSIPTKLYEYLGNELPILLTDYEPWRDKCALCHASINIDYKNPNVLSILHQIKDAKFYSSTPQDVYWESDRFVSLIDKITDK